MPVAEDINRANAKWIEVTRNGPYIVHGNIPLVRKTQIVSEYGEPLTWRKDDDIETSGDYKLCRCGNSKHKPFCDDTHLKVHFDGTETADTNTSEERQIVSRGMRIVVKRDNSVCIGSGFCGNRFTKVAQMVNRTGDTQVRAQVIAMIERCPSGSYSYALEEDEPDVEPDLPQQIAVTTEITSDGPIRGPLWVTGQIAVARADGQPFETRNRVTLCCCGLSQIKPLCDGAHRPE